MRWLHRLPARLPGLQRPVGLAAQDRPGQAAGRLQLPPRRPRLVRAAGQLAGAQPAGDADRPADLSARRRVAAGSAGELRAGLQRGLHRRLPRRVHGLADGRALPARAPRPRPRRRRCPPPAPPAAAAAGARRRVGPVLAARCGRASRIRRPAAPVRNAAGRRSASQRSNSRSSAAASRPPLRCTLPCSRATTSASSRQSVGTRRRSASRARQRRAAAFVAEVARPRFGAASCPCPGRAPGRPSAPAAARASRAHWSSTSIRCTPVSISGWCSGGCGTPHRRSTSGSSRASAPQSRSSVEHAAGPRAP